MSVAVGKAGTQAEPFFGLKDGGGGVDPGPWLLAAANPEIPALARPSRMALPLVRLVRDDVKIRASWDGTTVTLRVNLPLRIALVSSVPGR